MCRRFQLGGKELTEILSQHLCVNYEQAERLKIKFGLDCDSRRLRFSQSSSTQSATAVADERTATCEPEIAKTMGKAVRTLKKASFDLTTSLTKEIETNERPASPPKETPGVKTKQPSPDVKETISEHKDKQSDNQERPQQ